MRRILLALTLLSLVVPALSERSLVVGVDYSGRLLVKPKVGANKALRGLDVKLRLDKLGVVAVQVPSKHDPLAYGRQLMATGDFEYAHPDYFCHPIEIPNDPQVMQQWHLFQVSAPRAWDATAGSASVVIAITDTGVDLTHPDLQNRVPGYNAVSNLAQADGGDVSDIHSTGHGTRVTGLACATGNNGIGIAGVANASPFMPIRISNQINGTALMSDILEGITWAVDHGAKVINTSYDHVEVPAVETTGEYAWDHGAVSVWGVGNGNVDTKTLPDPDLDWDHKRVIVVGSTDQNDAKASFSNYGKGVDIFAPGTQLLTTNKGGGYGTVTGTSYSAPLVAGSLALILVQNPGIDLYAAQMRLFRCCRDLGVEVPPGDPAFKPGNDMYWGWGRTNIGSSLLGWPQNLQYRITALPPLAGFTSSTARGINDLGEVVGWSGVGNDVRATKWPNSAIPMGIGTLPSGALGDIAVAVNNRGDVALSAFSPNAWPYRYADGTTTRMPNNLGSDGEPFDLNEAGSIIGRINGSLPRSFVWPLNGTPYDPGFAPGWGGGSGTALNDNGLLTQTVGPGGGYFAYSYNGQTWGSLPWYSYLGYTWCNRLSNSNLGAGYSRIDTGEILPILWDLEDHAFDRTFPAINGICQDVNEFEEVVGYDSRNNLAVIFDGFQAGYLRDLLSSILPPGFSYLEVANAISNRHVIVGRAVKTDGQYVAFRAEPIEGIQVTVDLGQLGSNPIYLGALPPACVVDFRDEGGNYIPNSRREYAYNSGTGHIQVAIPPEVTGAYRMYFRLTNINDDPEYASGGWEGPGYLGKIYPPLNEPALPIDAIYVPDMTLYVGDCDSDNEIGISDYAVLSAAYGSFEGDTGWDRRADLDGDLEISIGDYAILSGNYGLAGD
ncbi:MAG: S8 family serine peptidase [Fimbriimonadaceae bacterium]|nr:S8 family serine peptidase [Fimbriimonadaceae bacterium]